MGVAAAAGRAAVHNGVLLRHQKRTVVRERDTHILILAPHLPAYSHDLVGVTDSHGKFWTVTPVLFLLEGSSLARKDRGLRMEDDPLE